MELLHHQHASRRYSDAASGSPRVSTEEVLLRVRLTFSHRRQSLIKLSLQSPPGSERPSSGRDAEAQREAKTVKVRPNSLDYRASRLRRVIRTPQSTRQGSAAPNTPSHLSASTHQAVFPPAPAVFQQSLRRDIGLRTPYVLLSDICGNFTDVYRQDGALQAQRMFLETQQRYDLLLAMADALPDEARDRDFGARHGTLRAVVLELGEMKSHVLQMPKQFDADARNCRLNFQRSYILAQKSRLSTE